MSFDRRLCVDHDEVRPDIVILGKALSGGVYPVSCFKLVVPNQFSLNPIDNFNILDLGTPWNFLISVSDETLLFYASKIENFYNLPHNSP